MFLCCWVTLRKEGWKPKCFSSSSSHVSQRELVSAVASLPTAFVVVESSSLWCVSLLNAQGIHQFIFVQKILCCEVEIIGAYVFRPSERKAFIKYPLAVGWEVWSNWPSIKQAFDSRWATVSAADEKRNNPIIRSALKKSFGHARSATRCSNRLQPLLGRG